MHSNKSERWLIPLAFVTIYLVWGSTYLANWYAIRDVPPFMMCGVRFLIAGSILFGGSFLFGAKWPSKVEWRATAECAILFFLVGNGGAVWALQHIESGLAALIISSQPLITVLLMWYILSQRPTYKTLFGVGIGMVGIYILVTQDQFVSNDNATIGVLAIFIAVVSWGVASVRLIKLPLPKMKMQSAGMQMLLGGIMLWSVSLYTGEFNEFKFSNITLRGFWSMVYLIVFGAIVAFSAFNYLLLKTSADKVSTSTYINPIIALFLGWWLNNEVITNQSLLAASLMITGVVFITQRKKQPINDKLKP